MTTATTFAVRVMVTEAWDRVPLTVSPDQTIAAVKDQALAAALTGGTDPADFVVKFRGALVVDEARTLGELDVPPDAQLVVLPGRRRPVR